MAFRSQSPSPQLNGLGHPVALLRDKVVCRVRDTDALYQALFSTFFVRGDFFLGVVPTDAKQGLGNKPLFGSSCPWSWILQRPPSLPQSYECLSDLLDCLVRCGHAAYSDPPFVRVRPQKCSWTARDYMISISRRLSLSKHPYLSQ